MTEKKLTPAEAWEHVKALCPWAEYMLRHKRFGIELVGQGHQTHIARSEVTEWPSGVGRWPPAEKPRRTAKMPEDYRKKAWFWDEPGDEKQEGFLCGYTDDPEEPWICEENLAWTHAEVECDDPAQPEPKWEPQVGDWVKITMPGCGRNENPGWMPEMDYLDGTVQQLVAYDSDTWPLGVLRKYPGVCDTWALNPKWLSPAEPPTPEPEWITPTDTHIGMKVEVRDYVEGDWQNKVPFILAGVKPNDDFPYKLQATAWRFARIRNPKYKG